MRLKAFVAVVWLRKSFWVFTGRNFFGQEPTFRDYLCVPSSYPQTQFPGLL